MVKKLVKSAIIGAGFGFALVLILAIGFDIIIERPANYIIIAICSVISATLTWTNS